jgi:hypothetical protein
MSVTSGGSATFGALVRALAGDLELLLDRCAERILATLPSYAGLASRDLEPQLRANYERLLAELADRRPPGSEEDLEPFVAAGASRARQGVSIEDMLSGWRVGLDVLRERAHERAPSGPERERALLELLELAVAWCDRAMAAAAAGHRQVDLELLRQEQHQAANLVRRALFGSILPSDLRGLAQVYGLDPAAAYYAVRALPPADSGAGELERFLHAQPGRFARNGLVALIDGHVTGFVRRLPSGAAPATVGVAGPVLLPGLEPAFRLASRALETALALGAKGVFGLQDLGLHPAVLADQDVGAVLLARYVTPIERMGTSGRAMLQTVARYLANDSALTVTARELGVHVNTVRYRLSRYEELTGRSLRENEALVEVWWALQRRRLAPPA